MKNNGRKEMKPPTKIEIILIIMLVLAILFTILSALDYFDVIRIFPRRIIETIYINLE